MVNLLDANTSSYETSTAGWVATGGTLSQSAGGSNPLGMTDSGIKCGQLVSTAAGTVTKTTAAYYNVTAGTDYVFREVVGATAAVTAFATITWYNASSVVVGTTVGTSVSVPVTATTSDRRGLVAYGTAPATTTKVKLTVTFTATAGSQAIVADRAELVPTPNRVGNLLTYNEYSAETSAITASVQVGWAISRLNQPWVVNIPENDPEGMYRTTLVPVAVGQTEIFTLDRMIPVTAGNVYAAGSRIGTQFTVAGTRTHNRRMRIFWFDSVGDPIEDPPLNPMQALSPTTGTGWGSAFSSTAVRAPEGATQARVGVEIQHVDSGIGTYSIDSLYLEPGELEYELRVRDDLGMVDLTIYYEPPGTVTSWSVTRFLSDGSAAPVRHTSGDLVGAVYSPGTQNIEDYEVPMGERVWYRIDWAGTPGAIISTHTNDGPTLADPSYVWLKSPGVPAVNTLVMMEAAPEWNRTARQSVTDIVGRANPIPVFDVRSSRTGDLSLLVWDWHSNELLNKLLDSGAVALIQAMPEYGLPPNLYVAIGDSKAEPLAGDATQPGWRWTLPVTEVDRPIGGIKGSAARVWDDVEDEDTWFTIFNSYESWEAVLIEE